MEREDMHAFGSWKNKPFLSREKVIKRITQDIVDSVLAGTFQINRDRLCKKLKTVLRDAGGDTLIANLIIEAAIYHARVIARSDGRLHWRSSENHTEFSLEIVSIILSEAHRVCKYSLLVEEIDDSLYG